MTMKYEATTKTGSCITAKFKTLMPQIILLRELRENQQSERKYL
jgi:hypothetical protein